eukprot:gene25812-11487_t
MGQGSGGGGYIVVQIKTADGMPLVKYACSTHVLPLHTSMYEARRLVKMIKQPFIARAVGRTFGELAFYFPDAIIVGVLQFICGDYSSDEDDSLEYSLADVEMDDLLTSCELHGRLSDLFSHRKALLNPPNNYLIQPTDELVLVRPTQLDSIRRLMLDKPVWVHVAPRWIAHKETQQRQELGQQQGRPTDSGDLLRLNEELLHQQQEQQGRLSSQSQLLDMLRGQEGQQYGQGQDMQEGQQGQMHAHPVFDHVHPGLSVASQDTPTMSVWESSQPEVLAARSYLNTIGSNMALAMKLVPVEYFFTDDAPENVLVCGWGEQSLMSAIIREADRGQLALPPGSEMVFVNTHDTNASLGAAVQTVNPVNISVRHVHADPMLRGELQRIEIRQFKWVDPDLDETNGIDTLQRHDMLRLDAMMMMVQLNVRKLIEDSRLPAINIICQKVALEGLTRFESRRRLPLCISMNLTSYDAKNLAQVAVNPGYAFVGDQVYMETDIATIDASQLCTRGERVSFWELIARAQKLGMVLLGYYFLPASLDAPVHSVVNPMGVEERFRRSGTWAISATNVSAAEKAPWVEGHLKGSALASTSVGRSESSSSSTFDSMEVFDPLKTMDRASIGDEAIKSVRYTACSGSNSTFYDLMEVFDLLKTIESNEGTFDLFFDIPEELLK